MDLAELEKLVEKMRELGITEYHDGEVNLKLGAPALKVDEKSEKEQQRARDERERRELMAQRKLLLAASCRIGPKLPDIR